MSNNSRLANAMVSKRGGFRLRCYEPPGGRRASKTATGNVLSSNSCTTARRKKWSVILQQREEHRLVAHACQGVLRKLPKSAFVFFIRCRETPLRQESTSGGGFKARSCHPVPFNGAPRRRAPCVIYVCSLDRTAHHARVRFCHIKPLKNRLRARSMDAEGTKR